MSGRFAALSFASWAIIVLAGFLLLYGLTLVFPSSSSGGGNPFSGIESTASATVGATFIVYSLFAILAAGAVHVLIAIYEQIEATKLVLIGKTPDATMPSVDQVAM